MEASLRNKAKQIVLGLLLLGCSAVFAAPQPAVTYQSMLNLYFDDTSGLISIKDVDLAFAPTGDIKAAVALVDSNNTVVQSHKFYPDPRFRDTVFARLTEVGPADFNVTKPGVYNIVFLVDGKPVSRLPVRLEQTSKGDDPFNPVKTYSYAGLWPLYAFLKMDKTWKNETFPELHLWVGNRDLAKGAKKDLFQVVLKQGEKVVAHSKETQGFIANKHYQEVRLNLYHPHSRKTIANAIPFVISDWTKQDGDYLIEVHRQSDKALIRRFNLTVKDGKIQPLAASELGHQPAIDYIVPRVTKGSQRYEFVEAIWLKRN